MPSGRVERLDAVHLFGNAAELDGLSCYRAHGQRRAAARVAVQLSEDNAVNGQLFVERIGDGDGVLAGHGVNDEQDFLRGDGLLDLRELVHQRFIDVQAAGRIQQHRIKAVIARVRDGFFRRDDGVLRSALKHGTSTERPTTLSWSMAAGR